MSQRDGSNGKSTSFLSLSGEIRNRIYDLLFKDEQPIDLSMTLIFHVGVHVPAKSLLLTNKTIHREAASVLYGRNCFKFINDSSSLIVGFLEQIGNNNASQIRHIYMDFPQCSYQKDAGISIGEESISVLTKMKNSCVNLKTLSTSLDSTVDTEHMLHSLNNEKLAIEALGMIHSHFKAISTLQEIILHVYEKGTYDEIRRHMSSYGWTFKKIPQVHYDAEAEMDDLGEENYGDHGYDDYDDYDDAYYDDHNDEFRFRSSYSYEYDPYEDELDFW
ncbi:hypothetical protein HJFPF1_10856 [Paramyrothecium foliicola]|nr:hypothetical protein HJFPF1_10856 [Paramyrothecium foliicola]